MGCRDPGAAEALFSPIRRSSTGVADGGSRSSLAGTTPSGEPWHRDAVLTASAEGSCDRALVAFHLHRVTLRCAVLRACLHAVDTKLLQAMHGSEAVGAAAAGGGDTAGPVGAGRSDDAAVRDSTDPVAAALGITYVAYTCVCVTTNVLAEG